MSEPTQIWQYKVIHINVEGDQPAPASGEALPAATPPFTKSYLEQEFPGYYTPPGSPGTPPSPAPSSQHPARQLEDFLNRLGGDGWTMVGIFPLGQLLMLILRRAQPSQVPPGVDSPAQAEILSRLQALETRLNAQDPAAVKGSAPAECLSSATVEALKQQHQPLSGSEAARALGFRSTASLTNLGNRAGYPLGLIKRGPGGTVAIYAGTAEPSGRGGGARRLWLVLRQEQLQGLL